MYSRFARYYDQLTANVRYEERADYFCEVIRRHLSAGRLLLDLGCGTGTLSLLLAARGWEVVGVDGSAEMLSCAAQKLPAQGSPAPLFLCQRMEELDLYGTVDVCVSALDSINHVVTLRALRRVFERLALFVETGGLFVFDANTPYKHERVLADAAYVYETPEVFCAWQNTLQSGRRVQIALDFFEKDGDVYRRSSESFVERAYTTEEFRAAAAAAGFTLEAVYTADTFSPAREDAQRLVYVMRNTTRHRAYENETG